jgi:two-component system, NtrC family, sensor kinase
MRKKLLLFLFFAACWLQMNAQTKQPVFVIRSDTVTKLILDNNDFQALKDDKGKFTFDQVRSKPLVNEFKYFNKDSSTDLANGYWFRLILKNESGKTITLSITGGMAGKVDYYIPDTNGVIRHYLSGEMVPWHQKDGFKLNNFVSFTIKEGAQITMYLNMFNVFSYRVNGLGFELYNTDKLETKLLRNYEDNYIQSSGFFYSVFTGIFLLAAVFNFLIFLSVREKVYLFFSLMLFSMGIWYAHSLNELLLDYPILVDNLSNTSVIWLFFLLHFIRHYFHVPTYYPRWDKFLLIISTLFLIEIVVSGIISFSGYSVLVYSSPIILIAQSLVILLLIGILVTIGIFLWKRSPERKTFLIATSPFLFCFLGALTVIFFFRLNSQIVLYMDYSLGISIVWAIIVFSLFLFKRYASQEKLILQEKLEKEQIEREKAIQKNELIAQQKIELEKTVAERTAELRYSLEELKSTQKQLIQSEKMASLGELTAGIAHEIQNPLNFVNNFSEVSTELIDEMNGEIDKGDMKEAKLIALDLKENLEKINHHGKRAGDIVKGMLQHSRKSSGQKEPTDINALADEYLRLSYHGLRAKDKTFNAEMKTDFDNSIRKINIIPQDIGRVLLNLFNNAFYAVAEKKRVQTKDLPGFQNLEGLQAYEPTVSVTTKKCDNHVIITVSDNGNGIPQNIVDKIFQPFFTTKPTGEGTGLGLSLSYDIVKAHGGEIKVETMLNAETPGSFLSGTTFTITLPTKA